MKSKVKVTKVEFKLHFIFATSFSKLQSVQSFDRFYFGAVRFRTWTRAK